MGKRLAKTTIVGKLIHKKLHHNDLTPGRLVLTKSADYSRWVIAKVVAFVEEDVPVPVILDNRRTTRMLGDLYDPFVQNVQYGDVAILPKYYKMLVEDGKLVDGNNIYFTLVHRYVAYRLGEFQLVHDTIEQMNRFVQSYDKKCLTTTQVMCEVHPCTLKTGELMKSINKFNIITTGLGCLVKDNSTSLEDRISQVNDFMLQLQEATSELATKAAMIEAADEVEA